MKLLVVLSVLVAGGAARSTFGGGEETVYDSQRDGLNHPFVVYDSRRDGPNSAKQNMFSNDASFQTIYDSKRDGLNHPFVVSDTRRDGARAVRQHSPRPIPAVRQPQQQPQQHRGSMMPMPTTRMNNNYPQQQQQKMQPQRGMGGRSAYNPSEFANYEVIYNSKRDGLNHPFVVYDSKRDGQDSPLRSLYENDPNLETIFDTKVHGWNHPWVLYDSKRDGVRADYKF